MSNPIICVDFDGVIHSYSSGWQGVDVISDDPVPGAIEWLQEHLPVPDALGGHCVDHRGPVVQIYSSRSKERSGVKAMKAWLVKHGLPREYISDGILEFPTQKPAAFLTIDDRAICFTGKFPSAQEIMSFKPWNKRGPSEKDRAQELRIENLSKEIYSQYPHAIEFPWSDGGNSIMQERARDEARKRIKSQLEAVQHSRA